MAWLEKMVQKILQSEMFTYPEYVRQVYSKAVSVPYIVSHLWQLLNCGLVTMVHVYIPTSGMYVPV